MKPKPIPQSSNGIFLSGRTFEDYRAMFLLGDEEVGQTRILDCPAGASDFGLAVRERGGEAVSVDPLYRLGADELRTRMTLDRRALEAYIRQNPDCYLESAADACAGWEARQNAFLADFERDATQDSRHYRTAALPSLPFPDGHFDIVVSAFLLFVYPAELDVAFHRRALAELARVCSGTVRVFPVDDEHGRTYPQICELEESLPHLSFEFTAVSGGYRKTRQTILALTRG
jgi:hypothetical protein